MESENAPKNHAKNIALVAMLSALFVILVAVISVVIYYAIDSNNHVDDPEKHIEEKNEFFEEINREEYEDALIEENHVDDSEEHTETLEEHTKIEPEPLPATQTNTKSENCTIKFGKLMLINPNFKVETDFIAARKNELISLSSTYGIKEYNSNNGDNLLDEEAALHIAEMINDYKEAYPGHEMGTRSCFRSVGTKCGRMCAATGESDHHTGLTCDLIDNAYGSSLDTSKYEQHLEWQWLHENSYKYGFIDRFPEAWAGGPMSAPANVDASGSTGLFETWHYRYVGVEAATEIATGKYNNGEYDSLEHYLKMRGLVDDLVKGTCK